MPDVRIYKLAMASAAWRLLTQTLHALLAAPFRARTTQHGAVSRFVIETLVVVLGFGALAVLVTYPLAREIGRALPYDLGDSLLNAWILAWDADRLRHGLQGWWDAPNFYPYARTLTYSEHLLGIAFFTAPIQWIFGNPVLAYNVAFLMSYILAGCGMYLLTVSLTSSRLAAVIAGVAFACLPYRITQLSHLQVLMYGWMPFGLWALHRFLARGSWVALVGFVGFFLLQGLSNLYFLYFFTLPVALVVIAELVRGRQPRVRTMASLAMAAVLILLVLAPIALAYYQTQVELGFVRSRGAMVLYGADVTSYVHASPSLLVWGAMLPPARAELGLFPGLTLICLASVGLLAGFARDEVGSEGASPIRDVARCYGLIGFLALLLSLGPEPRVLGYALPFTGPYGWLVAVIPGLDGIRVPARLAVVVYLALAVLAAVGVTVLVRAASRRRAVAASILLAVAVAAEGYAGPMPMAPTEALSARGAAAAYEWLRAAPPGAVLELPPGESSVALTLNNTRYQFFTLQHGHPLVNGFSGYSSPLFYHLRGNSVLADFDSYPALLQALRSLGVRYLVVHSELFDDPALARATVAAIDQEAGQLRATASFDTTSVFWLSEGETAPARNAVTLREIPARAFQARASHVGDRLREALDGDPDTRWVSGRRQTGDEWIELHFDRARDVRRLRLDMASRSFGDYPRGVSIESVGEAEQVESVYSGSVLPHLLQGLLRDSKRMPIEVTLPSNQTRVLRIRQTGQTRAAFWSIHELSVWETVE